MVSQIKKTGEGGRIAPKRKQTDAEKRRMKAVGGGKMAPAKTYKDRKDIGQSNVKRSPAVENNNQQKKEVVQD